MNFEKLEQLIVIPKKSDASKATREEFKNEMLSLLKEEGFSEQAEKYLWAGFSFCGAESLFDYLNSQTNEDQVKTIDELFKCVSYVKNEKSNGFKMCLSLLAYELKYCQDNLEIIGMLIKACVGKYKKKDGSISKDNTKIIEKYFVLTLATQTKLLDLNTLTIKPVIIHEFCRYIIETCATITGKKTEKQVAFVTEWLKSALPKPAEETSKKPDDVTSVSNDTSEKLSSTSSETRDGSSNDSLFGIITQLKELSARLFSRAEESEKEKKANQSLKSAYKENIGKLKIAENTISELQNQLIEAEAKLDNQAKQLAESIAEIEKLKTVISVYSEDKQSSMDGQLNAIASKLKTEYSEFKDALDLDMTADIGEILRDQLMRVFKILSKAGIDIESR